MKLIRPLSQNTECLSKTQSQQEPPPTDSPALPPTRIQTMVFLRIKQILGDRHANPPIEPLLPISRSQLYKLIQDGVFPAPLKLGRMSFWDENSVLAFLEAISLRKGK